MTAMQPKLELLTYDLIARILDEAFQLMQKPGIKVQSAEARDLLIKAGATAEGDVVKIPEKIVRKSLDTVPAEFYLYDRSGIPKVHYGGNSVHFDPGSSGVHILDPETLELSLRLSFAMKFQKRLATCTGCTLSCCFRRSRL
ncbi:MAG: trimethylamine methyltransferase family protein [Chloroflexi bacterium]|nr:trimethylamine methyltransferase family protein [Chloroflexota bacterium]